MKLDRIKEVEYYIAENKAVSLDKLCDTFNLSKNTIRRYINELAEKGCIEKIYGGVVAKNQTLFISYEERNDKNIEAKATIGARASAFIHDNDIIYIDSGTTTFHMVEYIKYRDNITVITNNLHIINALFSCENIHIISPGGQLMHKTSSFAGIESINMLKHYNITKAFMSTTGVSIENGLTNSSKEEFEFKKFVAQKSGELYLLADSSKFGISSLLTYCPLEDVDYVICEKPLSEKYMNYLKQHEVNFITEPHFV